MNTQKVNSPLEIHHIGEVALRVLSGAKRGSVLASVSNAIYLLSEHNELFWLITPNSPMHQRGMQVTAPLPKLNVGSCYEVVDQSIVTSSSELLDFQHAPIWMSPTTASTDIVSLTRLYESLPVIVNQLLTQHVPYGLGSLITSILHLAPHQNGLLEINLKSRLAEKAWPAVQGMILASMANDTNLMINYAKSLVGLGEGLTPSGDDFLGGFFFSRQLLVHHYPIPMDLPIGTYSDFILQSKPLTNQISYTFLSDHTSGHSVEPLHQLADGLLRGEPIDQLFLHAEKLISLGHSTGWGLLSGFLAGMSVINVQ